MWIYGLLTILAVLSYGKCQQLDENKALPKSSFYPFGPAYGDSLMPKQDDTFVGPIGINVKFPFFNESYESVFLSTNGILTFENGTSSYIPEPFPLRDIIGVAPYWSDVDTRNGGEIYYREIEDDTILNQIGNDIRRALPAFANFRPIWSFVATWDEAASFSIHDPNINNTFQVVITTNGRNSFTIFNYGNLMWTQEGRSQAGFNAGDSETFYILPGSFSESVLGISELSNIGVNGKWIFRVDSSEIISTGCTNDGFMSITPNRVYFVGGDYVTVTGPCFEENATYTMKYDNDKEEPCKVIDSNNAMCKVPYLKRIGRITVELSVNGSFEFLSSIVSKDLPLKPEIHGLETYYTLQQLGNVTLSWGNVIIRAIDFGEFYNYSIYYIFVDESTKVTKTFILNDNASQNGSVVNLRLILDAFRLQATIRFAYIGVAKKFFSDDEVTPFFSYASIQQVFINTENLADADSLCRQWHSSEPNPRPVLNGLSPCWRQLTLIGGRFPDAFGDFIQDNSCNQNNPQLCDFFHPGAKVCYRSISQFNGAGQQCCYSADNRLLVGPLSGGSLDIGHPTLDPLHHFLTDIYPFFLCCKFSNNCNLYYDKRPSDDGANWVPPVTGGGTGDPHFLTSDGLSYTFNGYGEYVLLKIDEIKFNAQVRMMPFKNAQGVKMDGTVFNGIAVQGQGMDSIQIELNTAKEVDIFVNGLIFETLNEDLGFLELNGFFFHFTDERYFLQFLNGINIEVKLTEERDAFLIITTVPNRYKGKTQGLLGFMDGNATNDFTLPNGDVLELDPSDDKEIFTKFGEHWRTNANSSVFTYFDGFSHENYNDITFTPKFISDGISFADSALEQQAIEQCGGNKNCLFDISTTGQLSIGAMSVEFDETIEAIKETIEEASKACVPLSTIFNDGIVNSSVLANGFEYQFSCNEKFCLDGQKVIKCENSIYNYVPPKCFTCGSLALACQLWIVALVCLIATIFK